MRVDAFSFAVGGLVIALLALIFLRETKPRITYVVEDRLLDVGWNKPVYTTSPWHGWRSGHRGWGYGPAHRAGFTNARTK